MGINDTEQQILEELKQLSNEPEEDTKGAEELIDEVKDDVVPEKEEKAPEEDNDLDEEHEEEEEVDDEEEPDEEEPDKEEDKEEEDKPVGAKFRHKLKAEKEERKRQERENQELRERLARLEGQAAAAPEPRKEEVEEIPDKEIDPEGYAIYQTDKLEKKVKEMEVHQARLSAERQWETMQAEHAKSNPDYNSAKDFLVESEKQKIKTAYPYATDMQIAQHLKEQEYALAGSAAQAGILPTQHIEFLAYQAGFRPGEVKKAKAEEPKKKPNLKNIKRNAKKSASLIGGSAAGESGDSRTADQLAAMGMEEIIKFGIPNYESAIKKLEARV